MISNPVHLRLLNSQLVSLPLAEIFNKFFKSFIPLFHLQYINDKDLFISPIGQQCYDTLIKLSLFSFDSGTYHLWRSFSEFLCFADVKQN